MIRVVFVDDEQKILQGLQRSLRSQRHEWEMSFAVGGQEALQMLASEEPFDVIVTDIAMPGIDGIRLLNYIKQTYPNMMRITLTGNADQITAIESAKVAHQYLSKPTDVTTLKGVIEGAASIMKLIPKGPMLKLLSSVNTIASVPRIIQEVREELSNSEPSMQKIGSLIQKDAGMSAKLLQMVNSAFFGLSKPISKPEAAVTILGLNTIKALATAHGVFREYETDLFPSVDLEHLWQHSVAVAQAAKAIAKFENLGEKQQEEAYLAGLLHDVGKLILAVNSPFQYGQILNQSVKNESRLFGLEMEKFGISHAEAAAYVLGLWGMPYGVIEAISFHHNDTKLGISSFAVSHAVCLANEIHNEYLINSRYLEDSTYTMTVNWSGMEEKLLSWKEVSHVIFNQEQ